MSDPFYQLQWQRLDLALLQQPQPEVWICQLHCAVPSIAGNKWLKLKYHIQQIQQHNKSGILSFGGAFSNHLLALAAAGQHFGFSTVGVVRSHQPDLANPTLQQCRKLGMQLQFVSPALYRTKTTAMLLAELQQQYPDYLIVPEGGTSAAAVQGVAELPLAATPNGPADLLCCASASGGTIAGLIVGSNGTPVLGISVVKDASLSQKISVLLPEPASQWHWQLQPELTNRAYGKFTAETLHTCLELATQQIYTEPVYTGKALHTLLQLLARGELAPYRRIAFFHTGGLQGLAGLRYRSLIRDADYCKLSGAN
ncbi:pyridoxal-phosphate dependent enzyme [Rheinheimera riviphila]|uniref:Pyridoxal-phosphate dependent enzyme n=1 Tax=Rheinheimera riviphila TaxID=1834037 RepID=A0A437QF32_9GAMM|nr:pyridoxal-phosphate dependent enzyme [Rheinheimera riviphila]RVU33055.1 pyridoxal-phosphate dependent enzyme [Rheinheimera riviphila]